MSWLVLTAADVTLNADEKAALDAISGTDDLLGHVRDAANEFRGAILAGGQAVEDTTYAIPEGLVTYVTAKARLEFLSALPGLQSLITDTRKDQARRANEVIDKLVEGKWKVERPTTAASAEAGTGNAELVSSSPRLSTRATLSGL